MKLEAKDRLYPTLTAVATITDIRDKKLLIHFDGWTSKYDYWCKPTSTDIHPVGWCARHNKDLQPPKGIIDNASVFSPVHLKYSINLRAFNEQFPLILK